MRWNKGIGPSAAYFIVSEDMRWQIAKSGNPPIYTLIAMRGKPEIVLTGTLADCKTRASNDH